MAHKVECCFMVFPFVSFIAKMLSQRRRHAKVFPCGESLFLPRKHKITLAIEHFQHSADLALLFFLIKKKQNEVRQPAENQG